MDINVFVVFTVPAANVYIGRKIMLSLVSGYWTHTYAKTDIIAPDCNNEKRSISFNTDIFKLTLTNSQRTDNYL